MIRGRIPRALIALALAPALLTACVTGDRPSFADTESSTPSERLADPAVARVAELLETGRSDGSVVARYDVLRKFGNTRVEAVLARDRDRWSITVGDVRYLDLGGSRSTCDLTTGRCLPEFDEARVSDALTTVHFAERAAATRLRRDAATAEGPAVRSVRTVAGQRATCALLPQPGGESLYCANALGLLALQDTADVRITLVALEPLADPALFETTGP